MAAPIGSKELAYKVQRGTIVGINGERVDVTDVSADPGDQPYFYFVDGVGRSFKVHSNTRLKVLGYFNP